MGTGARSRLASGDLWISAIDSSSMRPSASRRSATLHLREGLVHASYRIIDLGRLDQHRRRHPDNVAVQAALSDEQMAPLAGLHERRRLSLRGLLGLAVAHELDRLHEAQAAHLADQRVPGREHLEAFAQPATEPSRALGHVLAR